MFCFQIRRFSLVLRRNSLPSQDIPLVDDQRMLVLTCLRPPRLSLVTMALFSFGSERDMISHKDGWNDDKRIDSFYDFVGISFNG